MSAATMSSKGQVTVPKDVRDELRLSAGTRVIFRRNESGDYVIERQGRSAADLKGRLRYSARPKSLEEMDEAIQDGLSA